MDDLLIFIRALLVPDAALLAAFQDAGGSAVLVITPDERANASYPCLILEGEEGSQVPFSDNARAKYFDGVVRLEILTRTGDDCPDALDTLRTIQARCQDLLLGNPDLSLDGIQGQAISAAWNVPTFRQTSPTRFLPVRDPVFKRHLTTYAVKLNRISSAT